MSATLNIETPQSSDDTEVQPNGMTKEQVQAALAAVGRRKNDPGYVERLLQGAQEARRQINAEYQRELDSDDKK